MLLKLRRIYQGDESTTGILTCPDEGIKCFTLEDQHQQSKVMGETRIPEGTYSVGVRANSPMSDRYAERFSSIHQGMLWLLDVPGFSYVYIHVGNTDADTSGCILVGESANLEEGTIGSSRAAYTSLYKKAIESAKAGTLRITITNED